MKTIATILLIFIIGTALGLMFAEGIVADAEWREARDKARLEAQR